ncbi:MAG TPA: HAMP domain-containing sensor histidine kinase [Caulobacteraceae bacterium]|nr:HAMP domain-containing sensor histidine kinase [Caulobacteraceae bacterium]
MRLPRLFRTTPFRLTVLFLALFAAAASAFLAYIYLATVGEVSRQADASILKEMRSFQTLYRQGGFNSVNRAIIERSAGGGQFVYLLMDPTGAAVSGSLAASPVKHFDNDRDWVTFNITDQGPNGGLVRHPARGLEDRLPGGERLFVGVDVGRSESFVVSILRALWGAGALVLVLGLLGGLLVSRNVSRSIGNLVAVIDAARTGDLHARAPLSGSGDEYEELARGLNEMLERLERSVAGLRHAGDAIAHDLRSPLTRLRARLEAAMVETEAGRADPKVALRQALEDADGLLRTFAAVLAIGRLEAAGQAPDPTTFDPAVLASDMAELYQPLCEDKGLDFEAQLEQGLTVRANREFIAQALANILDNAVKYTPCGGAVMLRVRRRASGDVEFAVTDTGPGVPAKDRDRVAERFVRLENSRNQPGAGLGLSLVAAVARTHKGHLEIDEGPGEVDGHGPGLRVALVLPKAG